MAPRKIQAAVTTNHKCFICHRKRSERIKPSRISMNLVLHAYKKHKIVINENSRCCKSHLDNEGLIKSECYSKIRTKMKSFNNGLISMLDISEIGQKSIFEKFADFSSLEESLCLEITGWTKEQFLRFSRFITKIKNTKNRTKEQLIALYRFWLRTGTKQYVIAKMFNKNTTQQHISKYLSQIREAIYQDFVPFFLGTEKTREFYLKHNNLMVTELLELKNQELVIICDGTYTHIEKSFNNEMQYRTYSVQKSTSLIKPFIICCSDGYIIDCYGAFDANLNDASILKYVLSKDQNLKNKILLPGKTKIILDRGFRDVVELLMQEFEYDVRIPTCYQIEKSEDEQEKNGCKSKQLSSEQANKTRIVTKCRFIIEKKIGDIKKFQALDNVRNTVIGHIQIDYRIACAMLNFYHKPCCPDEKIVVKIARRIKKKSKTHSNKLNFLLAKQLDTKLITPIDLFSIIDFPVIRKNKIRNKIFFGSYQLKQANSYAKDLIFSSTAYVVSNNMIKKIVNERFINEFKDSKILAFELISRHRRSRKKINKEQNENYIRKFRNTYKILFQAFICNCLSGQKTAGCCSHVASVIYFLSYLKFRLSGINLRGEYLNKIVIDLDNNQIPNRPINIRGKRNRKESSSDSELTSSESEQSDFDNSVEQVTTLRNHYDEIADSELINFKMNIPTWGTLIKYKGISNVYVTNTSPVNYFLLAFWLIFSRNPNIFNDLPSNDSKFILIEIIKMIDKKNWNKAIELWINSIMICENG
ncbi:vacuolar sorting-associated 13c [Brachionus plicatilis]|uniref:Vacuolar sorting-associated 13c n=1 Tax=Brachionus plicatilis TaxID=10195 RepID=A0A3M7R806_BRAPC|nr:vacuolar sorting-associated 13c [Brachionus plicatilis]